MVIVVFIGTLADPFRVVHLARLFLIMLKSYEMDGNINKNGSNLIFIASNYSSHNYFNIGN